MGGVKVIDQHPVMNSHFYCLTHMDWNLFCELAKIEGMIICEDYAINQCSGFEFHKNGHIHVQFLEDQNDESFKFTHSFMALWSRYLKHLHYNGTVNEN